jgi:hypothetical protein
MITDSPRAVVTLVDLDGDGYVAEQSPASLTDPSLDEDGYVEDKTSSQLAYGIHSPLEAMRRTAPSNVYESRL